MAVSGSLRAGAASGDTAPTEPTRDHLDVGIDVMVVVVLTGIALVLRWPALGPSSLWLDDAWVALVHRTSGLEELRYVGFAAPGFAALLKGWLATVGFSELTAQLPALIAGVLAPPAVYLLARWRGWHRVGALLGGTVLVVSPIAIIYATRVKQYTTEALLGVVLLALALWLLDDRTDPRRWVAFVGIGALGTVVSAFLAPTVAAGLAAAAVAAMLDRDRAGVGTAVGWGILYGVSALAWYLVVLAPAVTSSISGFWADGFLTVDRGPGALFESLGDAAVGVLRGLLPVGDGRLGVLVGAAAMVVAVVAVATAGVGGAGRRLSPAGQGQERRRSPAGQVQGRRRSTAAPLLVLLLTPSGVAVVLAALQLAPLGGGRTDLFLYPSLALLLAAGTAAALRWAARWRTAAIGGSLTGLSVVLLLLVAAEPVGDYPRFDVRPLVATMEAGAGDDDALLIYPATVWAYALYTDGDIHLDADPVSSWGFSPRFDDPRVAVLPPGRDDPGAYRPTVAALGDDGDVEVVWLLVSHWREDVEDLRAQLGAVGFSGTEVARRDGARLERWERDDG